MSSATVGLAAALAIREADEARAEDSHFFYDKSSVNFIRGSFCEAVVADDLAAGILMGLQLSGMGKLRANTVVAGFPSDWENRDEDELYAYEAMLYTGMEADRGIVVLRDDQGVFKDMQMAGLRVNSSVLSAKTIQVGFASAPPPPNPPQCPTPTITSPRPKKIPYRCARGTANRRDCRGPRLRRLRKRDLDLVCRQR